MLWADDAAYMLLAYNKSVQTDLSQGQRKAILALLEEFDDG